MCAGEGVEAPRRSVVLRRCGRRVSATAGTIYHGTRTPLTVWFAAAWQMTTQKHGISAHGLKRVLGIGSEQTAWAMLHRYRTAMVRPGRERLGTIVEADETFLGGPSRASRARRVGQDDGRDRRRAGRTCAWPLPDTDDPRRRQPLAPAVPARSRGTRHDRHHRRVASYPPTCGEEYTHRPEPIAPSGLHAHELLPGVHRVASLVERWLLGTHQGGVKPAHIQAYLDEFTFRFNRRRSRARGMLFYRLLEQAVQAAPRTYRSLVAEPGSGRRDRLPPPRDKRIRPACLDGEPVERPWRKAV